jgi:hypothetical protein
MSSEKQKGEAKTARIPIKVVPAAVPLKKPDVDPRQGRQQPRRASAR